MSDTIRLDPSLVFSGLCDQYRRQCLLDLRLIGSNGSLMAHKSVMSSVCRHMKTVVETEEATTHPLVVWLPEHTVQDIKAIVDIIYFSEQSVTKSRAKRVAKIAEAFGLDLEMSADCDHHSQDSTWNGFPPKPAHQSTLRLADKKLICRSACDQSIHELDLLFSQRNEDNSDDCLPLDLSTKSGMTCMTNMAVVDMDVMDNVSKTIESIARNGPQVVNNNRRRKQSDPKPRPSKVIRFNEDYDNHGTDQTVDHMLAGADNNCQVDGAANNCQAIDMSTQLTMNSLITDVLMNTNSRFVVKCEPKDFDELSFCGEPMDSCLDERKTRILPLPKDCPVCDRQCSSHKQLIVHSNKDHKLNDVFKCHICGKEQKYAKSFIQHLIQCKAKNVAQN